MCPKIWKPGNKAAYIMCWVEKRGELACDSESASNNEEYLLFKYHIVTPLNVFPAGNRREGNFSQISDW